MSIFHKELISKQTAAVALNTTPAKVFYLSSGHTMTLSTVGSLVGSEEVDVYYSGDGKNFGIAYDDFDTPYRLTATRPQIHFSAPGIYAVAKDASTNAVGVVAGSLYVSP